MAIRACGDRGDFTGIEESLKDLIAAQLSLGKELLRIVGDSGSLIPGLSMPKLGGCCGDVPEPCWMPLDLGEVSCRLCAGGTGSVRLVVTNQDYKPHGYVVQAAGKDAGLVAIAPGQDTLQPKERATFTATFTAPQQPGSYEVLIWVRGCRDHYLRWTVVVGDRAEACCFEVTVDDTPDYIVHWYDHFYCEKPCHGSLGGRPGGD